jgi:ribosomal protein S12 methylthiotransferase accessory factor
MEMQVSFPGGAKVDAAFGPYVVRTDQPPQGGGEGSAPTPFNLFLASIATCAGIYVLGFLRQRQLPTEGVRLVQRADTSQATGMVERVEIDIEVPEGFPEKYLPALIRSAEQCAVKKHLAQPPEFSITTRTAVRD